MFSGHPFYIKFFSSIRLTLLSLPRVGNRSLREDFSKEPYTMFSIPVYFSYFLVFYFYFVFTIPVSGTRETRTKIVKKRLKFNRILRIIFIITLIVIFHKPQTSCESVHKESLFFTQNLLMNFYTKYIIHISPQILNYVLP